MTTDAAPVPTNQGPAAVLCHTSPYIMHNRPAGSMARHYEFQQSAGTGGLGVVAQSCSLLRRSSSSASSLKPLAAHVQHELLLQQGPTVLVAPGTHIHYADAAAATAAPTSPGTPGGSPRTSPSTATLSTASAAATRHSSSPRFKRQQQQASAAALPQHSNLMALADAAVACQQQQSGEPTAVAPVGSDRAMRLSNRVMQPSLTPNFIVHEASLATAVPATAAAARVSSRPAALQCGGFSDVYSSCGPPSAVVAPTAAAAACPAAVPQEHLAHSSLATAAAAAAAAAPPCLTKASLQDRLSQELEKSPLLTLLLSRLVRRLRQQQQQHEVLAGAEHQIYGPEQQQQQHDLDQGNVEYAAIMPGVLQKQHGNRVSSSSSSSSGGSCEYRAVRLTKQSYVELPAGCLLVGPGGTMGSTAPPTAVGAVGSSLSLQQQQQQCMPGSSTGLTHCPAATGALSQSSQQQQQCCVQQQGVASQATAAVHQQRQQQQSNAAFTSAHAGLCNTLNRLQQRQQQQAVLSTIQHQSAVATTNQHPELQQQMQTVMTDRTTNPNSADAKCVNHTTQSGAPGGPLATRLAAPAPASAAGINSRRQSYVGFVQKRPRDAVAAIPAVMTAAARPVQAAVLEAGIALLTAATAARPKHSSQQQQHPFEPAEEYINTSEVCPPLACHDLNIQLPCKRRCTISAVGSAAAAAAATGSHSSATGQQSQEPAIVQQQQRLSGQRWLSAPSPLTSSYPK